MNIIELSAMRHQSRGSVLLVSLIMLLVLTVIGVSTMSNIGVNEKMAANYRDHDLAFQAAEAALKAGERKAAEVSDIFDGAGLSKVTNYFTCTAADSYCFTSTCLEGLCFTGTYPPISGTGTGGSTGGSSGGSSGMGGGSTSGGSTSTSGSTAGICSATSSATDLWENSDTWTVDGRAATHPVSIAGLAADPKYIVEFRCYVRADPTIAATTTPPSYGTDWAYMYRVTALGTGATLASKAMVQSTYKVLR